MTFRNELEVLRSFAKRLVRKHQIPHHSALDIIAKQYGHAHWNALMSAWDRGWCPEPHELIDINEAGPTEFPERGFGLVKATEGVIAGEPYTLQVGFDDVLVCGDGWAIHFGHAPSEPANIETYKKTNALDDKTFLSQVMKIGMEAADGVREAIAKDWGSASMQPDGGGCVAHPLFKGVAREWFCLHCDGVSKGSEMAGNMWHCPKCSATPMDMFPEPFWKTA